MVVFQDQWEQYNGCAGELIDLLLPKWSPAMKFRRITSCPGYSSCFQQSFVTVKLTGLCCREFCEIMTGEQRKPALPAPLLSP